MKMNNSIYCLVVVIITLINVQCRSTSEYEIINVESTQNPDHVYRQLTTTEKTSTTTQLSRFKEFIKGISHTFNGNNHESKDFVWSEIANSELPITPIITTTYNEQTEISTFKPISDITNAELRAISEELFQLDTNNPAKYVILNFQGKTNFTTLEDLAPEPLIKIQPEIWQYPTMSTMRALLDNYDADVRRTESKSSQREIEENTFLNAIVATPVMRRLMLFLKQKEIFIGNSKGFKNKLKEIWFNTYSRSKGTISSSGFEHTFLAEIKKGKISGFHSWLFLYFEEEAMRVNYLGYLHKIALKNDATLLKLRLNYNGHKKPFNTMFVGTSPELEMSLYSLCFLTKHNKKCTLSLGGKKIGIKTYPIVYENKTLIATAFPLM